MSGVPSYSAGQAKAFPQQDRAEISTVPSGKCVSNDTQMVIVIQRDLEDLVYQIRIGIKFTQRMPKIALIGCPRLTSLWLARQNSPRDHVS